MVRFHVLGGDKAQGDDRGGRDSVLSCCPDLLLLLLLLFWMLGFPDSISPVVTAIIYEAGKCISDSGGQQPARSQHTAFVLLRPSFLHSSFFFQPRFCPQISFFHSSPNVILTFKGAFYCLCQSVSGHTQPHGIT